MRDIESSLARLTERTETLKEEVHELRRDVGKKLGVGAFWTGIGVVIAVIVAVGIGLGQAYWMAISTKFDALDSKFTSLEKNRQPIIVQLPPQASTSQPVIVQPEGE